MLRRTAAAAVRCSRGSFSFSTVTASEGGYFAMAFGNGDCGRLGTGNMLARDIPTRMKTPAANVLSVACGGAHTLVLLETGEVMACGLNQWGQCGPQDDGSTESLPALVRGLPPDITHVAAGSHHSLAVDVSGQVWAWGRNDSGQCGVGSSQQLISTPQRISGIDDGVVSTSAGDKHSLAVTQSGQLFSWGSRSLLGLGPSERWRLNPAEPGPRLVRALQGVNIAAASAGQTHSLCVDELGTLFSFGLANFHQVGTGSDQPCPLPHRHADLNWVRSVAAGGLHSVAATRFGELYCWGADANGALGLGEGPNRPQTRKPVRVGGPAAAKAGAAGAGAGGAGGAARAVELSRVAAGWKHSAGVDAAGGLYTWGWGGSLGSHAGDSESTSSGGQLGLGTENDAWEPTPVPGFSGDTTARLRVLQVSCGFNHTAIVVSKVHS